MMRRRLLLISVLLLAAAGTTAAAGQPETDSAPTPNSEGRASGYPMTVADAAGHRVTLPSRPERIASLTLMTDEILLDMIGPGRLAAATTLSLDPGISNVSEKSGAVPRHMELSVEPLIALAPDLTLVAVWSSDDTVRQLRDAGLAAYRVPSPETVEGVEAAILSLGGLVGARERAETMVGEMEKRLAEVEVRVSVLPPDRRLTVVDYSPGGTAFGAGSSWNEIVRRAGLINAAALLTSDRVGNVPLSQEQLLRLDPDIIVLPGWYWDDPQGARRFYRQFVTDPAFRTLTAVREGRVMLADERHRLATSQYIVAAVEDLARFAYPELFP